MRRRQLLASSVLAPFALAACSGPDTQSASMNSDATNFSYSPAGYDGVTIELDQPVERMAMDFYSAAALAPFGIKPVAVYGFEQDESSGK